MAFKRKIKKKSGIYWALVENYRKNGKVKQRCIKYLGKEINGKPAKRIIMENVGVKKVKRYYDVIAVDTVARKLGLHEVLGDIHKLVLLLVYSHILDRVSINKIEDWVETTVIPDILSIESFSTKDLYEVLTDLNSMRFEKIERTIFSKFMKMKREKTTVVLDVTDTYFEGNGWEGKKRRGKDEKNRKLLQIGLAVTYENGFPVMHKTYPGNVSNVLIFQDMLHELKEMGFKSLIIDRGMYSKENIEDIRKLGLKGIVGVRKTERMKKKFLSKIDRESIYSLENRVELKNTSVYVQSFNYLDGRLIVVYNPSLEILKREMHYERGGNDKEAKYLGYGLIFHNTELNDKEIVKKYFEKDLIERSFKSLKGVLALRPIRVWLKEHVEAHVKICYLSYAIFSYLNYKLKKLKITPVEALEKLRECYKVYLEDEKNDLKWEKIVSPEKIQKRILKKLV